MTRQTKLARMTIDLSKEEHKKLKAIAALMGKSMRELVLESLQELLKSKSFLEIKERAV
jgi:hypothetical protein